MQKNVVITIDEIGNPTFEANGFKGQGCTEATAALEKALQSGPGGVTREYKPEWTAQGGNTQEKIKQGW